MHANGGIEPETEAAAREFYDLAGPAAQVVVREVARAMEFDREEYRERVTPDVVSSARDALFASLLRVRIGTRDEYEDWRDRYDGEVVEVGSENVDRVAWHVAPFADEAAAATFQDEEAAAVSTLQRQAFGRIYRPRLGGDS